MPLSDSMFGGRAGRPAVAVTTISARRILRLRYGVAREGWAPSNACARKALEKHWISGCLEIEPHPRVVRSAT